MEKQNQPTEQTTPKFSSSLVDIFRFPPFFLSDFFP